MLNRSQSLAALLQYRAVQAPDRGYTWLAQGEEAADRLTYAGLDRRARAIAAALAGAVPPGERALLLHPPGLGFVAAFFGCLYAGVIAVPAYPPRSRRADPRLRSIAADSRPRAVLTTAALLARREGLAEQVPELAPALWLDTGTLDEDRSDGGFEPHPGSSEEIAFLQYTSGSTGTPKGVMVTHANLLYNLERIRLAFDQTPDSMVVGWLPLFHDMGLIGNVLEPCYVGGECVLMSPAAFLQRPARWLEAIGRFRGTTSGGPNFAYDLCSRSLGPEERERLDLSSWRVAFNGAEPVRRATLYRFAEAFAPCGFRRESFAPCYGLAEATLLATAARGAPDETLVSCGALPDGDEARIVDPESGAPVPDGEVGEVWLSGPSVAAGYWNRPEETRETFGAVLRNGGGPYLRTGDLGFVRRGELVVTGRLKDLIVLRGRNLHPQDLELTAEQAHPALRAGGGAAFPVEQRGEESVVVVHEVERRAAGLGEIADAVRRAVAEEHGVRVADVVLLRAGTIPKTSSGKIRRRECRARYLAGELEALHRSAAAPASAGRLLTRCDLLDLDPAERAAALLDWLREEIARRAGAPMEGLGPETVIAAAGLDSLALFDLQGRLERDFGLALPAASMAELSLAELRDRLLDSEPGSDDVPPMPPIIPGEVLGDHPVSPGQEALWLLERSASTEGVLHIAAAARLGSGVDGAALLRAALALSDRHPALRTTFAEAEGALRQRVHASLPPDLSKEGAEEPVADLDGALRREARRRFDLAEGAPLRIRIFVRPDGERVLLLVLHHLAGDFWSLAVLLRDWAALYAGREPLPDLAVSYADFVRWQQRLLAGPAGERLERYWLDRLQGAPLVLDLPTDRPRPRVAAHAGALVGRRLGPGLTGRVRELARARGATLFTTLLAAFEALLGRLTGQDDLLVGSPATARRDSAFDGVVGYFVNPVVLRADLAGDPPFAAHLEETRRAVAAALEHRDLPFPLLARRLQPVRDPGRPPVFQAMFVLQSAAPGQEPGLPGFAVGQAGARIEVEGLALEALRLDPGTAQLDLTLSAAEAGDLLILSCEHDAALFDRMTIERWLGHLEVLLDAAAARPEARLGELPLLSEAELHQARIEWNPSGAAPVDSLVGMFESWVDRTPEAVAVLAPGETLTYAELDRRANRLAHRLRALGVTIDSRVGLCAERSPAMIVAVLGILKAGAAYVPLDPAYPRERLAFLVEDARIPVLLTEDRLLGVLPETAAATVLLDARDPGGAGRLPRAATPDSLAYVIYTSGSTGRPKGAMIHHRGWSNLADAQRRLFGIEPGDRVLQFASLSFDASASEIAMTLSAGAALVLGPRERRLSREELTVLLRESTVATLPPAVLGTLSPGDLPGLKTLIVAGEACPLDLARRWSAGRRFFNAYGPTEASVCATAKLYDRGGGGERLPIGRPIARTEAHVLDARGNPVPIGVAGELCLGGPGLARGYLGRPDRTAASFVPHPFATLPGERLYRTGDLVFRRPDGEIEFLGRLDHQVKIRGFRIEPGEIEAALAALPGVREAAVVAREDVPGDRRLVAYVAGDVEADALRRALRERLPEHLVPTGFVTLAALPWTPSGKVDRASLSALEWTGSEESWLAPRTPVEEVLAGIWADVLGNERVGANDHFFDLGGHSLLATQVVSRLRSALGVEIPLRDLFEAPMLSGLAARVETVLRAGSGRLSPPLVPQPRDRPLPLSFAQQRLWFLDQLEPGGALYNMPGALRIEGPLDRALLAHCLGEIVRRHEALRTVFAAPDGLPVQVIEPPSPFALLLVDLSGLPESAREAQALVLLAEEAVRPFDLARGPLLRGALLRLAEEEHVLALTVHHIVCDGWSMGILIRELAALPSPLPELPVQYADFAAWQRSWLRGEVLEREIAFWRAQLDALPALLDLPADRPRPAVQSFRGASRPVRWPAELTRRAEALARREGATLFMVLLAAFQTLLARYGGQEDLAVGSPIAGRNREEIEGLIGFFVNTLVLRGDLTGAPSFRELLGRVRETALAAYLHQDVPFEKLVEELAPERSLTHSPLFQVMFVLQNAPAASLEIQGLRLRPVSAAGTTAKFDLTLSLEPREGGGLGGVIEYAADLFDGATIERLLGHFELLLAGAASDPDRLVADLPLLSRAELHQVRMEWNPAEAELDVSLVERFESWADRTPEAVAVLAPDEALTYAELDRRASRLAHHLRALGVKVDGRVGLCAERSPAMVVAVLGILKAGAAYVPLDPAYPRERLAFLVEDARLPVLLTEERLLGSLPETTAATVLLDGDEGSASRLPRLATPDSLAYVIYTSGSTGRPKGVMIPHRGWSNLADAQRRFFGLGPGDRVLQFASLSFDGSAWEIAMAFGAGATLVLGPRERRLSREELTALLKTSDIAALPPTVLATLEPGDLPELKTLIVAGEACPPGLARRWSAGRRLFNSYGPTEASVCATMELYDGGERLPIGPPIPRIQAHVLDARGNPVPIGVAGELCLGGVGLARGYLDRPDRTAASFVPHPCATSPGERLYRTGDLARWLPHGALEFLGRSDHQVKVRGFRIELGEIEAVLATLPGVREVAVVVREDVPGDRRLVAYVTGEATAGELRERLPDYMVPSAFVTLPALPLTANGKVDRKALPAPELSGARERYVAPRTREEELLAAVWAQVLRLPRVGVDDNFFELGGDSILSVQIVARSRQAGLLFTVRQIFEHQTVAELARHVTLAEPGVAVAGQGPVAGEVPLTPIQRWFFEQGFADPHHFNQALLLESREALDPAALDRAMAAVVEHHDALRMRFDGSRQENAPAEPVTPFHQVDLSGLPASRRDEAWERAAEALQAGFDLSTGPLTRLCLFAPSRLLWVTHHLVVDGVSWRLLLVDLEAAYRQAERGLHPTLPPKTSSFQDWSRRLAAHAGSDAVARELDFWRETVRVPVPRLPVDFPEAGALVRDRATVSFELSAEETADLLQTLPAVYHSRIDEALLSALARAVSGWTGSPRLRVDLEGHGREPLFEDLDVSRTVGWFTSLYPVVLEAGDAGPGEALVSAKERLRAVPERGIGYGLLRHLLPEAPAAEISFNYLGQVDATFDALSLFRASSASAGPMQSARARRAYPLEITGIVTHGRLQMVLAYGTRTHRRETVERLAAAYAGALRELIRHSRESDEVFTPSDFPKAGLEARGFEKLAALVALKDVEDLYPLTPLQSGMLFHSLMAPDSGVYVTQVTCTLPADLDAGLFRQAWERLLDRHGVLRTAFLWDGLDEPLQVVHKKVSLPWQELDWRDLPAEEQRRRLEELRHRERHTPLPLDKAPLMRFSLIRLGREYGLVWTAHHLLMDGWSLPLLVQELQSLYAAPASSALPPVRPFSDYVVWLRKQDASRAEPFWRGELAGFTAPNALGIDRPGRIDGGAGYAEHGLQISREVTARLQALASGHKLTLPTVTLGAWAVLVSRYSGDEDVVFGNVVSGRPAALPGVETMVGMFINTLPVRARVNGAEPLVSWLQHLQERQLARQEFEHSPLAQIQRWSEVPAGSPLFETLHVFESYPNAGDGGSSRLPVGDLRLFESTNYPVTLTLTAADQVSLRLTSDRARVEEEVAPRLLQHLATLLTSMAGEPRRRVGELSLLTAAEALQLRAWNETAAAYALDRPLHAWIEDQAGRSPEAVAVAFESEELTYGELDRRAERLARRLQALGCGPESRVGVLLERSCELLVALLGILKAGAAYVPLDPDHPADRLAFQDRDARLRRIVTRAGLAGRLPGAEDRFLFLEQGEPVSGDVEEDRLQVTVDPDHPAYVLYTSGSTGRPKGVVISHHAIVNRLLWMQEALCLAATDRVLQKTPFSFDVSVWELFWPLMTGARLVVARPGGHLDNAYLARLIDEQGITVLHFVPSLLQLFLEEPGVEECRTLRDVVCSGEALSAGLARRFAARLGHARLHNLYGPTEAAVDVTSWVCETAGGDRGIPIGRPIANTRIHLLDPGLSPVPVGVPGELFIAGFNLARGYVERPDLTAERFLPDPEGREPGERIYRTGDLARWREDGAIEYLGRLDHQVKIRGVRIELGEIEAALVSVPGVREAAVVAREEGSGDRRLVAYVAGEVAAGELRGWLRERLPDSMVPSAFVTLPALPLTANGKVDRKALPAQELSGARKSHVAPRTREEELLAAVWAQVLRLPRVGVDDNFFELGGDSILSIQIVARSRQAGLLLTVRQLFEHQTVAELARHVTLAEPGGAAVASQGPVAGEVPLTPIQRWFFEEGFADPHHFNQALLLESREALDPAALERAMAAIVEHHDALRMRFDGSRQENAPAEPVTPFHQVDLSGLPASRRDEACERAAEALQAGFDLSTGPLTRLCLFAPSRLLWVTHHLVVDGVSWRLLLADLEAAYRQAERGLRPALPPKTSSFQDWSRRLAARAGSAMSAMVARELDFWREAARLPVPRLPVDFPEAGALVGDEASISFELSAEETADLLQTLPAVFHTRIDEALLSALARAVAGWTGSPRLRVDLEGHGREPLFEDLDVSRTVGWFTSLYPVVLEAGDAGPAEALVSAKERLRAVPERGIGYGLLRHRLLPEAPVAEISFNYLGQVDATFDALSLFRASSASAGPMQSARAHRTHLLAINGIVTGGRLRMVLTYGARTHRRETVEYLAAAYAGALRELIRHSRESDEVFTPSDFPKAGLDASSFERLAPLLAGKNVEDIYPLTPLQSGMLFHSLMAPDSGVYVTQVTCTLPADLDAGLFRQAWERLLERHGVLRTAFLWDGLDEPLQVVRKKVSLPWQELDWSGLSAEERQRRFEELRHRERHTPLPLDEAPLMRFSLIRLGREYGLVWTAHHLLIDGWSLPLLVQELQSVYAAPASPALPPVRPFSDYVMWLRKQDSTGAEPFWRGELAGFTAPNALGIDRPGRAQEGAGHAEHGLKISREVTARLQALASRHKLTLPTVTLGAWAVLVSRYSGDEDVVFGNVVSGRPAALPGVETMVGMFINTLPVRARVNGAEPLLPWLQHLQERQLARQELEHSPLAQIRRWSEVPAGLPLFETLHVFESYPNAGDGGSSRLPVGNLRLFESTNYPVTLTLTAADQVSLRLTSDRGRVEEDVAPRLLQHLATLLTSMAGEPRRRVGELSLLTAAEALQLRAWNETAAAYPLDRPLHAWIEDQAGRSPEAVAVAFESEELTYGELDRRAERLARRLQALGCGPESRVGVLLERSCELLVALLGILKAGAAYVPLDPDHPADRLAFQDRDARLRRIVTRAGLADRLPGAEDRFLFLEQGEPSSGELEDRLQVTVDPDHPAYVLYTSGSTGRPKGVVISHRAIVNRLLWMQEALRLAAADRVLQKTPFSFDVSVWELFWPLMTGARLVVARPGGHLDNAYLARLIDEQGITVLHFVPSLLQLFLEDPGVGECRTLRDVVCSGEALSAGLARRFAARLGHARLHNLYGPTEAAVDVTSWVCESTGGDRGIPIGRPIANTRIHLLDPGLSPVPVGIPGELFIAGVNLARGYVERPDLTAERFLPDPEGREPGERIYRTGDLARWREDGAIEYLGRLDHQVKIRGVRIELGEIEAALVSVPGVREAAVVVREEISGDRRLVACVTGDATAGELRGWLRERLPDSMVPSSFVTLPALPLTANGKVDRKALSAGAAPELSGARERYVAPRTREEELLAAVWAQVLRLPRVGVDDNFFELGGDSILSVQIAARSRQAGLLFTVRQIFEHQTVARLARHVTFVKPGGAAVAGQGPVAGEVPLTPIQRWFFEQDFADPHHFNQALLLESRELLDPAALERAMAAIVEHHDALRMRYERASEGWRQENASAEPVPPFSRVDLSGLEAPRSGEAFERAVAALQAGFDLGSGPLTRLCLFEVGAGQPSRLLWVTHHLVVDGVSWRLLLADLEAAYRQAQRGLHPTLPPKTSSFQDWARRLAAHASSAAVAREVDFWREASREPVPRLPVDFPEAGVLVGDRASVSFELSAEETADLLQIPPAVYHSRIDEALLSALARAVSGWTGSPRLRVDLEGHGREPLFDDLDVSRTVGWFTSLYPVVLEAGDAGPGDALVSAKERLRAVPERGIGYGLLRHRILPEAPAAEISFNYLGQVDATFDALSLFRASSESAGPMQSARAHRAYPLEINGIVTNSRLQMVLTYGRRMHRRETVERLAAAYARALRELIQHSRESEEVFTPSDFPKAELDARNFETLAALLAEPD